MAVYLAATGRMDRRLLSLSGSPLIVHISADYPDAVVPAKTRAVAALVEGTQADFRHRIFSLNRRGGAKALLKSGHVESAADDGSLASWRYRAPPLGLFLRRSMEQVGNTILACLAGEGLKPDLVQGHKLSFEGIAARHVARRLGVPYLLTLQGNTDQRVTGARRDLRPLYRKIWHEAAGVAAFTPWIADWCERELGPRDQAPAILPCVPVRDAIMPPRETPALVGTAFHLDHWRNKNVVRLIDACASLRDPAPSLAIAGAGSAESERRIDKAIARAGVQNAAQRIGPIPAADIQAWMNGCAVFAMPSLRESFGMVFIEALLAGCPIVYPKGAAVDGYFQGAPFAIAVNPHDPQAIAAGIATMLRENPARKAALAQWQQAGGADRFRRGAILDGYRSLVMAALR